MPIVQSMDESFTTVVVDLGIGPFVPVLVNMSSADVRKALQNGDYISGDSRLGDVHFDRSVVKYFQVGKREVNQSQANRPSNLPL